MTAKQAEVWSLYVSGHRVTDIAIATGRSRGNVSTMIKKIRESTKKSSLRERLSVPCKYSPSCFTCPMHDCVVAQNKVTRLNLLPADME